MGRDYEIASQRGYEIGGSPGFITSVDRRHVAHSKAISEDEFVDDGRILTGYACLYNKCVMDHGVIKAISSGAFNQWISDRKEAVGFWLDHDSTKQVGSTDNGLELYSDAVGLAFRFKFPNTGLGREARQLAQTKAYLSMSVGFTYKDINIRTIAGEQVSIVKDARLQEISFVPSGAIKDAFGILSKPTRSLREDCETRGMLSDGAFVGMVRALQDLKNSLH
ncbi:HK97 family phage prohead protease [Nitrobacteraceae bacterium AZCC 2146]